MAEYRALYRKWRPKTFGDVVGQQAITAALCNQIIADKIGHAYLFTGTRGTGKTSCAKIFAKAINCENRHGAEPCGECECCMGIENNSILDVVEIDAASNNSVDDIRTLRDEAAYMPSKCKYKVYIIDEVHMLSTSAFNALLKIMEEPPQHVVFILATTEIHKVPATILSRCQRYDFIRISPQAIAERLLYVAKQEEISLTNEAADLIARLADGALRDALSILDTCAGLGEEITQKVVEQMAGVTNKKYLFDISAAVSCQDIPHLLQLVNSLREQSIDVKRLCEELVHHYRNYILLLAKPDGTFLQELPKDELLQYQKTASAISEQSAIFSVHRLAEALDKMGRSPDPRIELELALFELCVPIQKEVPVVNLLNVSGKAEPKQQSKLTMEDVVATETVVKQEAPVVLVAEDLPPWEVETAKEAGELVQEVKQDIQESSSINSIKEKTVETPIAQVQTSAVEETETIEEGAFEYWPQVILAMRDIDTMLYTYMKTSKAYFDGTRVLIDGGDMFRSFVKEYAEANEKIKNAIQQVTGARYAIGPYNKKIEETKQVQTVDATKTIEQWAEKGVPISRS